jgi:hypothetical protein
VTTKKVVPKPYNPYLLSEVDKKTSYTSTQLKDIHQKKLQKVRMYRATHLFYETPQGDDEQGENPLGECSRAVRNAVYPSIGGEKGNLNSAVYDQDSS